MITKEFTIMLKILFSPSEGKNSGGTPKQKELFGDSSTRKDILHAYNKIVLSEDEESIKALFGIKNYKDCTPYINDILTAPTLKAIERYQGVAYDYLKYSQLNKHAQEYLQKNTLIFSNLFGPILGENLIPNYKVKQGNNIGEIIPDKYYKERFSHQLDLFLNKAEILDLRAGYYHKFYKLKQPYTTLKFLKDGKSISHWAKAYRGIVLRELAMHQVDSLQEFMALEIEGLQVKEIKKIKDKCEIVYDIVEG